MHAAFGGGVAAALTFLPVTRGQALATLSGLLVVLATVDGLRLRSAKGNALFFSFFRLLASPREAREPASSTWYTLSMLLAVAAFERHVAVSGILVLALADPAASFLGRRYGRRPFLGATLEGTLVFALTAFVILALRHPAHVAAVAALLSALTERLSRPLDDNLTVPLVCGAAVTVLGRLLS